MLKHLVNDVKASLRAFDLVFKESMKYQEIVIKKKWNNSSLKTVFDEKTSICQENMRNLNVRDVSDTVKEAYERLLMIPQSLIMCITSPNKPSKERFQVDSTPKENEANSLISEKVLPKGVSPEDLKISELHQTDKELIEKLEKEYEQKLKKEAENDHPVSNPTLNSESTPKFHNVQQAKPNSELLSTSSDSFKIHTPPVKKYVSKRQQLNPDAKQRKVPSTRIGRMLSFGSLAAGLGVGTVAEVTRRTLGLSQATDNEPPTLDRVFLTEGNADRIVNTLCKVRGAALKIGQILSIQDNTIISPTIQKAFERVRQSADFMPTWQVNKVLSTELGENWRYKLDHFEEKPFAAASIGQVHYVRLKDGKECAMKIQYPGVAQGIESDINNLVGILKIWNVFPDGLFIDNLVEVAKRELAWEVDYRREAKCTKKFKDLLLPYPDYVVPDVIDDLSTGQVLTSSLVQGMPVDQCVDMEESHRKKVATLIMQLCLKEVFEFGCMQTDPNWSNFFYDPNAEKLMLLDFGATRSYDHQFVKKYIEVIKAAADGNRKKVLEISKLMGFLTGYESEVQSKDVLQLRVEEDEKGQEGWTAVTLEGFIQVRRPSGPQSRMNDAHVNTVMILAEVFSSEEAFDFGSQDTTVRVQHLVPTIVAERLCPPPEEIYSLHRKLSGVFLLCAKLKVKINCRQMFMECYRKFKEAEV